MADYAEIFCQAVDEIVQKKLEGINFDTTIICDITDDSSAEQYKYQVSNGSAKFIAYSQNTTYKTGEKVYVTVPNGDYSQEKIIIGKYVSESSTPFIFTQPFETLIDITGNVINKTADTTGEDYWSLLANGETKEINIFTWAAEDSSQVFINFTRLGIQGDFRSYLGNLDYPVVNGDYGLRLDISYFEDDSSKEFDFNRSNEPGYIKNSGLSAASLYLSSNDMYGNPYDYSTYYQQEIVFDISQFSQIYSLSLNFYQNQDFKYSNGEDVPTKVDEGMGENIFSNNLFIRNPYVSLGYDVGEFNKESFILYTPDSLYYDPLPDYKTDDNKKALFLRWIHDFSDTISTVKKEQVDSILKKDDFIHWYKYNFSAASADKYSGVYWSYLDGTQNDDGSFTDNIQNTLETTFVPSSTIQDEQIKVIAKIDGNLYYSNILKFTNNEEMPNYSSVEAVNSLTIQCDDNSHGSYFIYQLGGKLNNDEEASLDRQFKLELSLLNGSSTDVADAWTVEWKIPLSNTMLVFSENAADYKKTFTSADNKSSITITPTIKTDEEGLYKIISYDYTKSILPSTVDIDTLSYKISNFYSPYNTNNTVECTIKMSGKDYIATRTLQFGYASTSGTDVTLTLSFDPGVTALIMDGDNCNISTNPVRVTARLYDAENREIDLSKYNKDYKWSWYSENDTFKQTAQKNFAEKDDCYIYVSEQNDNQTFNYYVKDEQHYSFNDNGAGNLSTVNGQENSLYYLKDSDSKYKVIQSIYNISDHGGIYELRDNNKQTFEKNIKGTFLKFTKTVYIKNADGDYEKSNYEYYQKNKNTTFYKKESANLILIDKTQTISETRVYLKNNNVGMTENYYILQYSLKWGNTELKAWLPIPVRKSNSYKYFNGPTEVRYDSEGNAFYYKQPYTLQESSNNKLTQQANVSWSIVCPSNVPETTIKGKEYLPTITQNNELSPLNFYVKDITKQICIKAADANGSIYWLYPLLIYQNNYPAAMLNKWDKDLKLEINEDNGSILATSVAAGKKESDNTFTGVIMGAIGNSETNAEDVLTGNTGIFGYNHGAMSYGFRDDGTAFIGPSGAGRINFDGKNSTITSNSFISGYSGLKLDLDSSPYLQIKGTAKMLMYVGDNSYYLQSNNYQTETLKKDNNGNYIVDTQGAGLKFNLSSGLLEGYNFKILSRQSGNSMTNYISIDSSTTTYPLQIGNNFMVTWDGKITANEGYFTGDINATGGKISGDLGVTGSLAGGRIVGSSIYAGHLYAQGININDKIYTKDDNGNSITSSVQGWLGYGNGANIEGESTTTLQFYSDSNSIVIHGTPNVRITGGSYCILSPGWTKDASTNGVLQVAYINSKYYLEVKNIPAEQQTGIYARFA